MIKLTIHGSGVGTCSLTGKEETDGLTVTFEDGTLREGFLCWKAFRQLLGMKAGKAAQAAKPAAAPASPANGPAVK